MDLLAFLRRLPSAHVQWWSSTILACCIGVIAGLIWAFTLQIDMHPPLSIRGSGATIASVTFEGFRDGALRGHAVGPLRLYVRDDAIMVDASGSFAIHHPAFRIEEVTIRVPDGMQFVASRKGKKYYSVTSAAGERIAPHNRVYFPDATSAEAAGFIR